MHFIISKHIIRIGAYAYTHKSTQKGEDKMQVIAIVNRKGGVGKTATAQALGAGLQKKGYKVLFVDLDSQANLSYALKADPAKPNSLDLLTEAVKPSEAVQQTENGYIIAGSDRLARADANIEDNAGKYYHLKEALEALKKSFDYVVIDTPAALDILTLNALTAAHGVIIPVQADIYSLQGIDQLQQAVNTVKKYSNKDLKIKGVLITRYNSRANISKDMKDNLEDMAKALNTKVYKTPIRECTAIKEAQFTQQDIFTYAPKSNASADYIEFIKEFLKGEK